MTCTYPLFKFLKRKYANNLINQGEVRLGTLFDFCDQEKHAGLICDVDEGRKELVVYIDKLESTGDELAAFGMPFGGDGMISLVGATITICQDSPDCYIYSTTESFFSESLVQAVKDGKDACVMIKKPEIFFDIVDRSFGKGGYVGVHSCLYGERKLQLSWDEHRDYLKALQAVPAAIIKPTEHAVYREVRAIWLKSECEITPENVLAPDMVDLVVEVDFTDINLDVVINPLVGTKIGVEVIKKDNKASAMFSIEEPCEVFTPVVIESGDGDFIGFKPESDVFSFRAAHMANADYTVSMTEVGPLLCVNRLDDVVRLRYFSS